MAWAINDKEQTMGKERTSDVDFLRGVADYPDSVSSSEPARSRLRDIAAEMEQHKLNAAAITDAESGSLDKDADILLDIAYKLRNDVSCQASEAGDLFRIGSRLKSLPEPCCRYCNGHGFFFPNKGFDLREEKEVRVRICDCKAGTKRCLSEIEEGVANIIQKE